MRCHRWGAGSVVDSLSTSTNREPRAYFVHLHDYRDTRRDILNILVCLAIILRISHTSELQRDWRCLVGACGRVCIWHASRRSLRAAPSVLTVVVYHWDNEVPTNSRPYILCQNQGTITSAEDVYSTFHGQLFIAFINDLALTGRDKIQRRRHSHHCITIWSKHVF